MVDENLHEKIESYLLGQLPPREAERFKADISTDPELAEQVALQRLGLMGMQRLAAASMRASFDEWDADLDSPPATVSPPIAPFARNPWVWTTILLLLLFAAGAFWHFGQMKKERGEQELERRQIAFRDSMILLLQTDYREKAAALEALTAKLDIRSDSLRLLEIKQLREELDRKDKTLRELEKRQAPSNKQAALRLAPPPTQVRGSWDNDDSVQSAAKQAYENTNYNEAIRLLKSIPPDDPRQAQVTQMLPYALFYAGRFQEAIPSFLNLWEQDGDFEAMNAQGYLLLCYIAEGKMLEARQMRLIILPNERHKFYQTAVEAGKEIK